MTLVGFSARLPVASLDLQLTNGVYGNLMGSKYGTSISTEYLTPYFASRVSYKLLL